MTFLSAVFLFGLPLATVPVIVHLLNRRRREVIGWGAMQFLQEAMARRRRMWQLDDWLLMLLRVLAVVLFIVALSQPLVTSSWFGSSRARDIIVVLDTSMSTARSVDGQRLFDRQMSRFDEIIDRLNDGDVVRVLLASSAPKWLNPIGVSMNADSREELRARLQQLQPTLARADILRCVETASNAEPGLKSAARLVAVLSDGQAASWRTDAADTWQGLADRAEERGAAINAVIVGDPASRATNLAVDVITPSRIITGVGQTVDLVATVRNTGAFDAKETLLSWFARDESIGATTVPKLGSAEETVVVIEHTFDRPGVYHVSCRLETPDDLTLDNTNDTIVEVVEAIPVIIVEGTPHADPRRTETGYLLSALGHGKPRGEQGWRSVYQPRLIHVADLADTDLAQYRCLVLANVARLSDEALQAVARFVSEGGGLWIAAGDRLDRAFFNEKTHLAGRGLSPLALDEAIGEAGNHEKFDLIHPPMSPHPATRLLSDTERLDIENAHLYRRYPFAMDAAPEDVSILLRTGQGDPLVVENIYGQGRVIVQGIPLGVTWSNLPLCQAYVIIVHEWLSYLIEPTGTRWSVEPGEAFKVGLPAEAFEPQATVHLPVGGAVPVDAEAMEDQLVWRYENTVEPGVYGLAVADRQGGSRILPFHVRRDREESDLTPLSDSDRSLLMEAGGVHFGNDPLALNEAALAESAHSEPMWTWLLLALLAMMLVELILAGRLSRKRNEEVTGATMETELPSGQTLPV